MAMAYALDPERARVYTRAQGLLTYARLCAHLYDGERSRLAGYDELFDATGADTDLTAEQVRSLFLRASQMLQKGPIGATAIVATNPVVFGMARMYGLLCHGAGVPVAVFRTVAEAEQWLDAHSAPRG
jgi:hypothetical protein